MTGADPELDRVLQAAVDGRAGARAQLNETFAREWNSADRAGGHQVLDGLAAATQHSVEALEILLGLIQDYRLTHPAIRRVLLNADDIADVEQSTLAVVATRISQFDGRSRFGTWLFTIAGNEAKMLLRTRSRRPQTGETLVETGYLARLSTILGDRDLISRAVNALSPEHRDVLVAREINQLDYDGIAAQLGVPVGTVRSRLHRAREAVARELRDLES